MLGRVAMLNQDRHILGGGVEGTASFAGVLITSEAQRSQPHFQTQSWYQFLPLGPHLTSVVPLPPASPPPPGLCTSASLSSLVPAPSFSSSF